MDIIPKEQEKTVLWQIILTYFLVFILLALFLAYLIFSYINKNTSGQISEAQNTLIALKTSEEKNIEQNLLAQKTKIDDFTTIVSSHYYFAKIFSFMEENAHPKVWFSSFNLNPSGKTLSLSGEAENFIVLSQQINALSNKENAIASFSSPQKGDDDKVSFNLEIKFDPLMFKKNVIQDGENVILEENTQEEIIENEINI